MIVCDTGPLVALVDSDDHANQKAQDWFRSARSEEIVIPAPCLGEAWYLIGKACGPMVESQFLSDLADGAFGQVIAPTPVDLFRASELTSQYADLPLGGTDACVIAIAERYNTVKIATLDHRHFRTVRSRQGKSFILLPE